MPPQSKLDDLRIERTALPNAPKRFSSVVIAAAVALILVVAVVFVVFRSKAIAVHTAVARSEATGASGERTVLNASGYVTARLKATVSSKVTGKVTDVLIEEGMQVAAGQVLARLDDTNVKASLLLAEAQFKSAKSSLEETRVRLKDAEQDLERQSDLRKKDVAPVADYDHARAAVLAFRARLEQQQSDADVAERTVEIWRQQLDDTIIRAPFAGIVTSKAAQPGEMISPMSSGGFTRTGICTVVAMESLEIEIDVNESYINRVVAGQPVEATLDAYADWKIPCHVIAIIPTADRDKSTVKVRVGFDKLDPRILPEMAVKVAFRTTSGADAMATKAVLVPKTALQEQGGRNVVMVVQGGRVERRAVTIANVVSDEASVSAGLAAGERVVLDAPKDLIDGAMVKEIEP